MTHASPPRRKRRQLATAALLAGAIGLAGCASNPATGEKDVIFMSQAEEKRVGQQNHPKILQQFGGAYDDPALTAYVNQLGQRLARESELPNIGWKAAEKGARCVNGDSFCRPET